MNKVLLLLHQYFLAVYQLSTTNCQLVATTNWAVAALARSTVSVSPLQLVRLVVAVALVSLVITQATIRKSRETTATRRRRRSSDPTHIFDKITMKLNYVSLTSLFASLSAVFICAQVWEYDRDQICLSLSVCLYPSLFLKYNIELNYSPYEIIIFSCRIRSGKDLKTFVLEH